MGGGEWNETIPEFLNVLDPGHCYFHPLPHTLDIMLVAEVAS